MIVVLCFSETGSGADADWRPAPRTTWQWQLSGTVDTSVDAQVYDIDLFDTPPETIDELHLAGRQVVCHFSAGSYEIRRPDSERFPRRVIDEPLDPPYASERWLDIRSAAVRPIMEARLDLARLKQCDGVEPDKVDGYEHKTGFKLKASINGPTTGSSPKLHMTVISRSGSRTTRSWRPRWSRASTSRSSSSASSSMSARNTGRSSIAARPCWRSSTTPNRTSCALLPLSSGSARS